MIPLAMPPIMFASFVGAAEPMIVWRPSGGGPERSAFCFLTAAKNSSASSLRLLTFVLNVHPDVQLGRGVERVVRQGNVEPTADLVVDHVAQPGPTSQLSGHLDVTRNQVDTGDRCGCLS